MACWSGVAPSMRMRLSSRCHAALALARVAAKSQSACSARRFLSALAALTAEMPQRTWTGLPAGGIEVQRGLQRCALGRLAIDRLAIGVELRLGEGHGELHGEVDLAAGRPGVDGAAAGDEAVLGIDGELGGLDRIFGRFVGVDQIDDEVRVLAPARERCTGAGRCARWR